MTTQNVSLKSGESTTVSFTYVPNVAKTYQINVNGLTGSFTAGAMPGGMWLPSSAVPIHWQWQLSQPFNIATDLIPDVTVYDIDMFETSAATVAALHALGCKVIAYIDVGTSENFRPDFASFPASVQGNTNGWPGEKWLDITKLSILQPIMQARFALAASRGFDAVELDNMDGSTNSTGFTISTAQNLAYVKWCMSAVHALGMSVCQKNWIEQCAALQPYADFCLNEEAYKYNEYSGLSVYVNAGKAVFEVEYSKTISQAAKMNAAHINSMTRDMDLVSPGSSGYLRLPCIPDSQNNW